MKRTADGWIASTMRTLAPLPVFRPTDLAEAVAALGVAAAPAVVAGGTDLVAQFNEGYAPSGLLALRDIAALRRVHVSGGRLHIGSCVTHDAGSRSDIVRSVAPGFAYAWGRIANVRVRMTATIGGNLMARRTRYELPILIDAIGGELHFDGALLVSISIPLDGLIAFDYDRSLRPIVTQALCLRRIAGGAIAVRATIGTEATEPLGFDVPIGATAQTQLRDLALGAAAGAYAEFPESFSDRYSSNAYLRRAGRILLERQLARLADASA